MGTAGILLHMRTKRSVLKVGSAQIGCNHLASRDCLRGSPLYIGEIVSECTEIRGNSKERVEGVSPVQTIFIGMCLDSLEILTVDQDFYR